MEYKNNYQRKQAVWREKWMRKVEERQKRMALYKPIIDAGISLRKAFEEVAKSMQIVTNILASGISEFAENMQKPEFIEELKRIQKESQNI